MRRRPEPAPATRPDYPRFATFWRWVRLAPASLPLALAPYGGAAHADASLPKPKPRPKQLETGHGSPAGEQPANLRPPRVHLGGDIAPVEPPTPPTPHTAGVPPPPRPPTVLAPVHPLLGGKAIAPAPSQTPTNAAPNAPTNAPPDRTPPPLPGGPSRVDRTTLWLHPHGPDEPCRTVGTVLLALDRAPGRSDEG